VLRRIVLNSRTGKPWVRCVFAERVSWTVGEFTKLGTDWCPTFFEERGDLWAAARPFAIWVVEIGRHVLLETKVLDQILKLLTAGSVFVGAIAVYIALYNNSRQLGAQIFLTYSDRVHLIRRSLSPDSYNLAFPGDASAELSSEARRAVVEATFLIFEFYELRRHGYVARRIWRVWEPNIVQLLRTSAFQREWRRSKAEFEIHPHFVWWVAEKSAPPIAARS
jgi:hypothetical protein